MNPRLFKALLGAATLALVVSSCQSGNSPTAAGGKPLIAEGTTGVTFSEDFNPYDQNSVAAAMNTRSMVNEPLIEFDQLDATAAGTHPWLATAYAFQNGGKDLQVEALYVCNWAGPFFGVPGLAISPFSLGKAKMETDGTFAFELPDFSADPLWANLAHNASLMFFLVDVSNGEHLARLTAPSNLSRKGSLKVASAYPAEIQFGVR